jgi:hypothetical protein
VNLKEPDFTWSTLGHDREVGKNPGSSLWRLEAISPAYCQFKFLIIS